MAGLSRTLGIFGGFVAVVGAALYPIYFRPLLLPDEYKKEQSINRAGIVQEDIQPPGILDSRVSIDCLKGLPEVRPEYFYRFKQYSEDYIERTHV